MPTMLEVKDEIRTLAKQALDVVEDAKMTNAEKKVKLDEIEPTIEAKTFELAEMEDLAEKRKKYAPLTGGGDDKPDPSLAGGTNNPEAVKSLGTQFIESAGYKELIERGGTKGNFTTGQVDLKTLFTEGSAGSPGPGGSLVLTPVVLPGIVDIRFRRLTIADLIPSGATDSPLIRYLVETVVTNAAATVAEGGLAPESALIFSKIDEALHKIMTFLPMTDEMLEDWLQARSYIDARLSLFIQLAEEVQLVSGDGTGTNLVGLLNRAGLATTIAKGSGVSPSTDNQMDAMYRQITAIRYSAFLEPDAIVIDPLAGQDITLSKNAQGQYYAGGPFLDQANQSMWGKRLVETPAIPASSALVGAFAQGAQLFRKGGITVEASNSHADFFQRGQTAIRAEERLALAVYRPGAFGTVTAL